MTASSLIRGEIRDEGVRKGKPWRRKGGREPKEGEVRAHQVTRVPEGDESEVVDQHERLIGILGDEELTFRSNRHDREGILEGGR